MGEGAEGVGGNPSSTIIPVYSTICHTPGGQNEEHGGGRFKGLEGDRGMLLVGTMSMQAGGVGFTRNDKINIFSYIPIYI